MGDSGWWDLGLVGFLLDLETGKGSLSLVQTADGFLYGFVTSSMEKPALQYSKKDSCGRFLQSGFTLTLN